MDVMDELKRLREVNAMLLAAFEYCDDHAGTTNHKPAGQKSYLARVIPFERWEAVRAAIAEAKGERMD